MPTITDVARHAAVSTATVSRALSQPGLVKPRTRERVLDAVERLGYAPNRAARALRTLRAAKILVTVPDISNSFFAAVIRGAEEAAREAGYAVVLGDTRHEEELENRYAAMLRHREVDGLLFLGHRMPPTLGAMLAAMPLQAPIVNGCEYSAELHVPSVHIDNAAAGREAVDHLVSLGHRNIGVVTGPMVNPINRDRLAGVRASAARHRIVRRIGIRHGDFSVESGFAHTADLLRERKTAIFCFSDEMAIGAFRAIDEAGLRCPEDVSVVGFDDIRLARYLRPRLTTISQPTLEIGRIAVGMLVDLIEERTVRRSITLQHQLIVRDSTASPALSARTEPR